MKPNGALAVALVAGALAVGIVVLDTLYSLEARLDAREAGGWRTVAQAPASTLEPTPAFERGDCAGRDLRLVVDNHKPFGETVRVTITHFNGSAQRDDTVLRTTWALEAWEVRTFVFSVPDDAFASPEEDANATGTRPRPVGQVFLTATVDDMWMTTCVFREA